MALFNIFLTERRDLQWFSIPVVAEVGSDSSNSMVVECDFQVFSNFLPFPVKIKCRSVLQSTERSIMSTNNWYIIATESVIGTLMKSEVTSKLTTRSDRNFTDEFDEVTYLRWSFLCAFLIRIYRVNYWSKLDGFFVNLVG